MRPAKPFSIAFCSFWLYAYYCRTLAENRRNAGALALLARTLARAPRWIPFKAAAHYGGHCYVITLEEDFLCDRRGRSVLRLYENGTALAAPHARSVDEIVAQGAGRYLHVERQIFFSPSDNVPPERAPRSYAILETLTDDAQAARGERGNAAARALDKLGALLGGRLDTSGSVETGESEVTVYAPALDLRDFGLGLASAESVTLEIEGREGTVRFAVRLRQAGIDSIGTAGDIALRASIGADGRLRAASLDARIGEAEVSLRSDNAGIESGHARLGALQGLRTALSQACDGDDSCGNWLADFLSALCAGLLPGVILEPPVAEAILEALRPGSVSTRLGLALVRGADALRIAAVPA